MSFSRFSRIIRFRSLFSKSNDILLFSGKKTFQNAAIGRFYCVSNVDRSISQIETPDFPENIGLNLETESRFVSEETITVRGDRIPNAVKRFSDIEWPEEVRKVVDRKGFTNPTSIQANSWPILLAGRDLVGIAKTGCGKTLAFLMPAIVQVVQRLQQEKRKGESPMVLVLAPTRELAQQINEVAKMFGNIITSLPVFGGVSKLPQRNIINRQNPELLIATPGRLIDLMNEYAVTPDDIKFLVLDEADRMLDMGFEPQIRKIIEQLPKAHQTAMFSATWPKDVRELARDFLNDYIQINVGSPNLHANPNITQNIIICEQLQKRTKILSLLNNIVNDGEKVLIFAETKAKVDMLARFLRSHNYNSAGLHGDKSQLQRDMIMKDFRSGRVNVLIATDVASRGLDVNDIKYVINMDFPRDIEDYIHRIGRTGRVDKKGVAYSYFCAEDAGRAADLISILKQANQEVPPALEDFQDISAQSKQFNDFKKRQRYARSTGGDFQMENYFRNRKNFRRF